MQPVKQLLIGGAVLLSSFLAAVGAEQSAAPIPLQTSHDTTSAVAGVHWVVPKTWAQMPPRQMRVATYAVPAAGGDSEGGECAVFFFGSGQGGDVDANIERWAAQFKTPGKPARTAKEVNGLKVTLVQIAGTYLTPGGPMMQSQGEKQNYRLLGAIVAAPEGSVFFKLTGPAKTATAAEADFNTLIGGLSR
jgi:hypothetical protein